MCCSTTAVGPTIFEDNVEEDGALIDKGDKEQKDITFRLNIIEFNTCIISVVLLQLKI